MQAVWCLTRANDRAASDSRLKPRFLNVSADFFHTRQLFRRCLCSFDVRTDSRYIHPSWLEERNPQKSCNPTSRSAWTVAPSSRFVTAASWPTGRRSFLDWKFWKNPEVPGAFNQKRRPFGRLFCCLPSRWQCVLLRFSCLLFPRGEGQLLAAFLGERIPIFVLD